jgi:hypothetical protein
LKARFERTQAGHFVHVDRLTDTFDFGCAERLQDEVAFAKLAGVLANRDGTDGAAVCIREARLVVCPIGVYST